LLLAPSQKAADNSIVASCLFAAPPFLSDPFPERGLFSKTVYQTKYISGRRYEIRQPINKKKKEWRLLAIPE